MSLRYIRVVRVLAMATMAFALEVACMGCGDSSPPAVPGSAKNDAFLEGQVEPAKIQSLVVYVSFSPWGWSMTGADKYPAVTIDDRQAIQELCEALASERKHGEEPEDKKSPVRIGVIEARLVDGTNLFIDYCNRGESTSTTSPASSIDRLHYHGYPGALASWLDTYVYGMM